VPSAAAIANAIYDATGVRLREPPFTPERVKAALDGGRAVAPPVRTAVSPPRKRLGWYAAAASLAAGHATASLTLPFKPAIAPIARPDPAVFSAETIARGRLLAETGDCAVCHTAPGGTRLAGGRALETPFGTIHSTNITPDPETGIGAWSYPAFERAMREGVHRDGSQLYPAFPYTSFTKASDADLQALYAYLMAEPPIRATAPAPALRFPFDQRPLMAAWNTLFHKPGAYKLDPRRSDDWNRGAYLVEGLGHCSACHSPRNALGAEEKGAAHLAGGLAEGWDAPALTALSKAPVPWTEGDFYTYLRTGFSERHGAAAGPMAPVIDGLRGLPDSDLRAMATYLASFNPAAATADAEAVAARAEAGTAPGVAASPGARIYDGACAVCHESEGPSLFGVKPRLVLNSNLHGGRPDNLIRVVLDGMRLSGRGERGAMPAFRESFSDAQMAELVTYMRNRFAPSEPPWTDVPATVARLRAEPRTSW
jgi:nicotinate dehydrogenase subunit B